MSEGETTTPRPMTAKEVAAFLRGFEDCRDGQGSYYSGAACWAYLEGRIHQRNAEAKGGNDERG